MSEDEKREELAKMLLRQHDLNGTVACIENKCSRFSNELKRAAEIAENESPVGNTTIPIPTGEQLRSAVNELSEARRELRDLDDRLRRYH